MFKQYIDNLILNLDKKLEPQKIDIVLEGGSNNGYYELGVLLFLKEMENQGFISVNRISGASIGSLMGFHYLNNSLDRAIDMYSLFKKYFKEHLNLYVYKQELEKIKESISDETFEKMKNDTFFVTTIDYVNKNQILYKDYKNKDHLIDCIYKSCYIPTIIGKDVLYKGKYIDGIFPHIFQNREKTSKQKILYIRINQLNRFQTMFSIKEKTMNGRILEGILDCYNFFLHKKPSYYCNYVNNWSLLDFFKLRMKQFFIIILIYIIFLITNISKLLFPFVSKLKICSYIVIILRAMKNDILIKCCF